MKEKILEILLYECRYTGEGRDFCDERMAAESIAKLMCETISDVLWDEGANIGDIESHLKGKGFTVEQIEYAIIKLK